ncbi:hypothetical protein [Actinoallomurus sp. CA-150999]|uniref:hypothetical protein n=1 Tax=Actinoallomurus sp. CA-150999 TaxID=3239887 RepID=UPI003D906502
MALVVALAGVALAWYAVRIIERHIPGCAVTGTGALPAVTLTVEQADNAATIAAVGRRLGTPDHAVTVALATAMQESNLRNLPGGDRDSAGLFQQRPSQNWGTRAQITDPVHAATAFYDHLRRLPDWQNVSVTQAAQQVQHSATPDAYARWEPQARVIASALTGERSHALSCHGLTIKTPTARLASTAIDELGNARLTGVHDQATGWALGDWLVAHAARLGVDRVTFDGQTWTAATGRWSRTGRADGSLTLHDVGAARSG